MFALLGDSQCESSTKIASTTLIWNVIFRSVLDFLQGDDDIIASQPTDDHPKAICFSHGGLLLATGHGNGTVLVSLNHGHDVER